MNWAAPVVAAILFPGAAASENTPDGPATLITHSGAPAEAGRVLMSWTVTVGPGGREGIVRPLLGGITGEPVELPATPGTYTFPLPRTATAPLGLVQDSGDHAIVTRELCRPAIARVARPVRDEVARHPPRGRGGRPGPRRAARGHVQQRARRRRRSARRRHRGPHRPARQRGAGARARRAPTRRRDADQRGRPPGRPAVVRRVVARGRAHRERLHRPHSRSARRRRWRRASRARSRSGPRIRARPASRSMHGPRARTSRRPTTRPSPGSWPAPPFDLVVADRQRLRRGVRVQVRGVAGGPARVTAASGCAGTRSSSRARSP